MRRCSFFLLMWIAACGSSSGKDESASGEDLDPGGAGSAVSPPPEGCHPGERLLLRPGHFAVPGAKDKEPSTYLTVVRNPEPVSRLDGTKRAFRNGDECPRIQDSEYECIARVTSGGSGMDLVRLVDSNRVPDVADDPYCVAGIVYLQEPADSDRDRAYTAQKRAVAKELQDQDKEIRALMQARGLLPKDKAHP